MHSSFLWQLVWENETPHKNALVSHPASVEGLVNIYILVFKIYTYPRDIGSSTE